jgi:hypothetical protein
VDQLADSDRTAQLQGAVFHALRHSLPGNLRWEADSLSQFARLILEVMLQWCWKRGDTNHSAGLEAPTGLSKDTPGNPR